MNSADLVCAMAFRFVTLKALFMIYRNKFIHQLGYLPRASFSTGTMSLFFLTIQHKVETVLQATSRRGRMKLTFEIFPDSFATALRNLLYSHD
jgi:hypothetical protein